MAEAAINEQEPCEYDKGGECRFCGSERCRNPHGLPCVVRKSDGWTFERGRIADLAAQVTRLEKEREQLIRAGVPMSNLCYNLKQPSVNIDEHTRKLCGAMQRRWDAVVSNRGKHA